MASLSNATTNEKTTIETTTATTTATTISPTTVTSTAESIEEDIEEAIEISEDLEAGDFSPKSTETGADEYSDGIAVFPSTSKGIVYRENAKRHVDLLEIDDEANTCEKSGEASNHDKTSRSQSEEPFNIDDKQLSGGKLAQHFVTVDDDDDNDDEPQPPMMEIHSRHESTTRSADGNKPHDEASTADDVSDFFDEEHQTNANDENEGEARQSPIQFKTEKNVARSGPISVASSEHSEKDHSLEELIASNHLIVVESADSPKHTFTSQKEVMPLTDLDDSNEGLEQRNELPASVVEAAPIYYELSTPSRNKTKAIDQNDNSNGYEGTNDDDDDDDNSLEFLKLRILALKHQQQRQKKQEQSITQTSPTLPAEATICNYNATSDQHIKPMERVPISEFSKDILEDITEESEQNSLSNVTNPDDVVEIEQSSLSVGKSTLMGAGDAVDATDAVDESVATEATSLIVSLNVIKMLETSRETKQQQIQNQHNQQRRESNGNNNGSDQPGSGRDSSSLMTNSTEYRTLQEDFAAPTADFYLELTKRDELISKLTESLQQSSRVREQLQQDTERLNFELQAVQKQLNDNNFDAAAQRRVPSYWLRADQESNGGQRISEISMDLISESDDDLERNFLTDNDNEDKMSRNSRERQLSMPRQMSEATDLDLLTIQSATTFNKQIEQFQKYLTPSEVRLFYMVQKKFDDFLVQELEKCRVMYETEHKILVDRLECEKNEKENEILRLRQARQDNDTLHSKEMEDLRKYFETKCADLEKQYSDDVFSQKSQRQDVDSSAESSDGEHMPEEAIITTVSHPIKGGNLVSSNINTSHLCSKENSPRKRTRAELLLSPSHHQMTPCGDAIAEELKDSNLMVELKAFYQQKLHELQRNHEIQIKKLNEKLKYFESRYPEDDFMKNNEETQAKSNNTLNKTVDSDQLHISSTTDDSQNLVGQSANASLIIIDQDELNLHNESQVIQKIIDEYERRLQEQLILARQDIVLELERQIQNLLSETTADDLHWPPELILLREKLTAKSQLEIAQLQMKHEEEMARVKQDYEKQKILQRQKNMRRSIYEMGHDTLLAQVSNERDQLRQLLKSFHHALSGLAKCVEVCEDEANATLNEQVQRLLLNFSIDQQPEQQSEFQLNLSSSINMFNSRGAMRLLPDVQTLLEVVDSPILVQFINNDDDKEMAIEFDLKECLERLNEEANYILELTEQRNRLRNETESDEKIDTGCDTFASIRKPVNDDAPSNRLRSSSFNETSEPYFVHVLNSMPADFQYAHQDELEMESGQNNPTQVLAEIAQLKTRLVKSENDRFKLQQELEHTISRNAELGKELESLRNRISQLNSLNHIDYAEGYGLGIGPCSAGIKTPAKTATAADESSQTFAQLQERARHILSSPPNNTPSQSIQTTQDHAHGQEVYNNDYTIQLLQTIEDFCRESDRIVDSNKREREDLQAQLEQMVSQIKYQNDELTTIKQQRDKMEEELKASISKIFDLREIIAELESRIEEKEVHERMMAEKIKELKSYIHTQNQSNETLQNEVISLKTEIDTSYHERIRPLEKKLQNVRPTAEQFAVMEHVVEQLRDIEATLDQKTKTLESLHHSGSSNSCSHSATEDVSAQGALKSASMAAVQTANISIDSPLHSGSPVHPSPRQHSLTLEGVQRLIEKLAKHTRVEEAAIKRIRDLEMQVSHMCTAGAELQQERDTLQERMSEQSQRISALQMRLDEQRQRADELQRIGTSDLNIRIHDLQSEVNELNEKLSVRDKQMATQRQQLEKSKNVIHRLEAELAVKQQPDRSTIERLENEVSAKQQEIQKLKNTIKNEMINKQHLPDLMETMLADKNDEIDLLREQYDMKMKELSAALEVSVGHSLSISTTHQGIDVRAGGDAMPKDGHSAGKLSARTLSDIISIGEYDEPDELRRAAIAMHHATPLSIGHRSMDTSKDAVANLTHKRTEDLIGFSRVNAANTYDDPRYFLQEQQNSLKQTSAATVTPTMQPRQINFSALSEEPKLKSKDTELDKNLSSLEKELQSARLQLANMQQQLQQVASENVKAELEEAKAQLAEEKATTALLRTVNEKLVEERDIKSELLTKHEKELHNLCENETKLNQRIQAFEAELKSFNEKEQQQILGAEQRKVENEQLNAALKAREVHLEQLNENLKVSEARIEQLKSQLCKSNEQIALLQQETERQRHQLNSDNSSKLLSVEEIAQQVEKELNYSAQLDSNILKAIESEEENNLDLVHLDKSNQTSAQGVAVGDNAAIQRNQGTDDENFTGERELLNQLEVLRAQINIERERNETMRRELLAEKQHSQDFQKQDIAVLSALRKRLENAIEQENELHKALDLERERYECLNAQYTALQRAESRRNSSLLLKSPTDSPRKGAAERTVRSLIESDLSERLRSEIKLLSAQNERERERSADLQRNSEREFARYKNELEERKEYCEQLNREMSKLQRERDTAQQECEHLQERLIMQSKEIESLEWRLATLQEAEAQRAARRERYHKETLELQAEMQELKTQTLAVEAEKEAGTKLTTQLRMELERSTEREGKLAEALSQAREIFVVTPSEESVPLRLLQNEIEVKRQMAETLQLLTEERCRLQSKCEALEKQVANRSTVEEMEERYKQMLGRYLRIESYRKALVYQKRYLKISLLSYVAGERCLAVLREKDDDSEETEPVRDKKKIFKTVAIAVIAIHRMKYIVNMWRSGKRIVSKSTFTITQQKRPHSLSLVGVVSSTTPDVSTGCVSRNDVIVNNNNSNQNKNNPNFYNYQNNAKKVTNGKVK